MFGLDLDPRVVLHTSAGVVILRITPSSAEQGTVSFPVLGAVPYRLVYDFPVSTVILDVPMYGPTALPVDLSGMGSGGGGASSVELPMLGTTPYEVVLGPPNIAPEQLATNEGLMMAALGGNGAILLGLAGVLAYAVFSGRKR